jgi:hypothetical protein
LHLYYFIYIQHYKIPEIEGPGVLYFNYALRTANPKTKWIFNFLLINFPIRGVLLKGGGYYFSGAFYFRIYGRFKLL